MSSSFFPAYHFCVLSDSMVKAPIAASLHFRAPLKSLALLLFFQVEFLLLGTALSSWFRRNRFGPFNLPDLMFLGQCAAVCFAQIWSLFSGLRPLSNVCLLFIVAVCAMLRPGRFVESIKSGAKETHWRCLLLVTPLWLMAALNALTAGFCYDSALYHLLTVRWVWEYGAVPGLANVHGRLGHNSGLSSLAGLFGVPFGLRVGQEFVNPAIVLLVAAVVSQGLSSKGRAPRDFQRLIYAMGFFVLVVALIFSSCLSSPQPDVGAAAIAILVAWYFREILFANNGNPNHDGRLLLLCLSAAAMALEFKLSYLGLSLSTGAIALLIVYLRHRNGSVVLAAVLTAGVLLFPWVCSGYLTSGYPLFPSQFGRIAFDWTVPAELVHRERDWALSWARAPGIMTPELVLRNWDWVGPWLSSLRDNPVILRPLGLTMIGVLLLGWMLLSGRCDVLNLPRWFVLTAPSILALAFWFFTAPAPRYAEATLWIFSVNILACPFAVATQPSRPARFVAVAAVLALLFFDVSVGLVRLRREGEKLPNFVGGIPDMTLRSTRSGLGVWVPTTQYNPGDWELLSTPPDRFNPQLELRGPTLRQGFRIRE